MLHRFPCFRVFCIQHMQHSSTYAGTYSSTGIPVHVYVLQNTCEYPGVHVYVLAEYTCTRASTRVHTCTTRVGGVLLQYCNIVLSTSPDGFVSSCLLCYAAIVAMPCPECVSIAVHHHEWYVPASFALHQTDLSFALIYRGILN